MDGGEAGWGEGKLGQGLGALKRGEVGTPLQTKHDKVLGKAPDKAELFAENLRNLILITQVSFYLLSLLELI